MIKVVMKKEKEYEDYIEKKIKLKIVKEVKRYKEIYW